MSSKYEKAFKTCLVSSFSATILAILLMAFNDLNLIDINSRVATGFSLIGLALIVAALLFALLDDI